MKYTAICLILLVLITSCSSDSSMNAKPAVQDRQSQINEIRSLNNEMLKLFLEKGRNTASLTSEELIKFKTDLSVKRMELINLNLKFYNNFPEDTLSAYCLADVQELYDASGAYLKAIAGGVIRPDVYDMMKAQNQTQGDGSGRLHCQTQSYRRRSELDPNRRLLLWRPRSSLRTMRSLRKGKIT